MIMLDKKFHNIIDIRITKINMRNIKPNIYDRKKQIQTIKSEE